MMNPHYPCACAPWAQTTINYPSDQVLEVFMQGNNNYGVPSTMLAVGCPVQPPQ
jgi:hypothetical protein